MQEDHRLAPADGEIVEPGVVDIREAAIDDDPLLRLSGQAGGRALQQGADDQGRQALGPAITQRRVSA